MRRLSNCLIIGCFICSPAFSQNLKPLLLKDAISMAKKNSLDYKIAVNMAQSSYWNYQAYRSGFLPKLMLNGLLPDYYRSISAITLPSGQNAFVSQNVANSSVNLNLSQNIGLTGGNISVGSSLRRIDNFGSSKNLIYTSIPLTFSYFQSNLFYNDFKWQKKIEPLRLKEAQRGYIENIESISYNTVSKYFDLLRADIQLKLDQQNLKNIDTLIKISKSRFEIGTIQLNDILQLRVSLLNAKKAVAGSTLNLQTSQQNFTRFLNLPANQNVQPALPDSVIYFTIDVDVALNEALNNRKFNIEYQRRRLEAEQEIAKTKAQTAPSVSLRANIGLTQTANTLTQTYQNLLNNQAITIGFNIPIMDWGVNRSQRKRAEANLDLEKNTISQQQMSAEQEIFYQITKWAMQKELMEIAKETSELAKQRYEIAKQKYAVGSLSYTDFNNAQLDKDRAVIDYLDNLQTYWLSYFHIRRLTLFDFEQNRKLEITDLKDNN